MLAGVLGAFAWLFVLLFSGAVLHICWWSADWGVFNETRAEAIIAQSNGDALQGSRLAVDDAAIESPGHVGIAMIRLANGLLRAVAHSFALGYFWVAASAIYLLLRRHVDHTETDEVFSDDDSDSYGLPPLENDDAGDGVAAADQPPDNET